jgi:hypothetical protein
MVAHITNLCPFQILTLLSTKFFAQMASMLYIDQMLKKQKSSPKTALFYLNSLSIKPI